MTRAWDIRTRILLVALVPTLLLGLLLTVLLTSSRLTDLEEAAAQRGQALAKQLAAASVYGLFSGNEPALQQLARAARTNSEVEAVALFDRDGKRVVYEGAPELASQAQLSADSAGQAFLHISERVHQRETLEEDPYTLSGGQTLSQTHLGDVVVLISVKPLQARKQAQVSAALLTLIAVLGGSIVLAVFMTRTVSTPIRLVAQAVDDIGRGALDTRVPLSDRTSGSLRQLAEGVNEMAARLGTARDELEQRVRNTTQALRERTEEAEQANLAKSRFLAAASHDLRQPMHALGLFIADLVRRPHSPETRELVERISASATAMEDLLDSLLDISQLDAGVVTASPRSFALGPLFERIANDYRAPARKRDLLFRVRPTPYWIHSDPALFERIIVNLITNALRYTVQGSVMVVARRRGDRVRVEVRDSGVGIPEEAQDWIFLEFMQLDNAARDRNKGLGLGLAIVSRLARLLHHRVSLRSAPLRGSVFAVEAPLASPVNEEGSMAGSGNARSHLAGTVIAIVDDDKLARQSLAGLLQAWGCTVLAAEGLDGLLAQLTASGLRPDALLSDFRLPGELDGLALIAQVRQYCATPELPCLLLSGDTGADIQRRADAAAVGVLHKPVRAPRLRSMLNQLLAEARARTTGYHADVQREYL